MACTVQKGIRRLRPLVNLLASHLCLYLCTPTFTWSCTSSACSWTCSLPGGGRIVRRTLKYSCYITNSTSYNASSLGRLVSRYGTKAFSPYLLSNSEDAQRT